MIELRLSPFKPGKDVSSSTKEFYYIYKDGKPINRTLYSRINYVRNDIKGILMLNKRQISEIKPDIWRVCREKYKNYPRYTMSEDIVLVNGETGKIILDTNNYDFIKLPNIISDYIFVYNNSIYDNEGNLIKSFQHDIKVDILKNTIIIRTTLGYTTLGCYIFDKNGKLLNEYE